MAIVAVEVENNTKDPVTGEHNIVLLTIEEDGEYHEYLRKLVRREDLRSVRVVKPAPVRKPAGSASK